MTSPNDLGFWCLKFGMTAVAILLVPEVTIFGQEGGAREVILIGSDWEYGDMSIVMP